MVILFTLCALIAGLIVRIVQLGNIKTNDQLVTMLAEHEQIKAQIYIDHGQYVRELYESYGKRAPGKYFLPPYQVGTLDRNDFATRIRR